MTQRIAVFISGRGSNLKTLLEHDTQHSIHLVLSDTPGAPGLQYAQEKGILCDTLDFKKYSNKQAFEEDLLAHLQKHGITFVFLAGFMRILSPFFVAKFPLKILNIHPSLLPKYKGLHTHQRAIDAGDKEHGCSVHFVTTELDDGPVLIQSIIPIKPNDTAQTLAERVLIQEHIIYPMALHLVVQDKICIKNNMLLADNEQTPLILSQSLS